MNNLTSKAVTALTAVAVSASLVGAVISTPHVSATQYHSVKTSERVAEMQHVYQVCESSHAVVSHTQETACGALQDSTDTEFLCQTASTSPTDYCWVEDKTASVGQPYLVYGVRN